MAPHYILGVAGIARKNTEEKFKPPQKKEMAKCTSCQSRERDNKTSTGNRQTYNMGRTFHISKTNNMFFTLSKMDS